MTSATLAAGLAAVAPAAGGGEGFEPPTLADFFPEAFLLAGTPFAINRIMMVRLIMTAALVLFFGIGAARAKVVPGRFQNVCEMLLGFARVNIAEEIIGERRAKPYVPIITTIFLGVLFLNISGVIPGLNIAATSVIGMPIRLRRGGLRRLLLRRHQESRPGRLPAQLRAARGRAEGPVDPHHPHRVPVQPHHAAGDSDHSSSGQHGLGALPARPVLRRHERPVLPCGRALKGLGVVTFGVALAFVLFEVFVATLQAYIFALLTAVYIGSSLDSH